MNSLETLQAFFGWCTVINFGFMAVTTVMMMGCRGFVVKLHSRLFGLDEADINRTVYLFLAQYKIVWIAFCFVPWVAIQIIR